MCELKPLHSKWYFFCLVEPICFGSLLEELKSLGGKIEIKLRLANHWNETNSMPYLYRRTLHVLTTCKV